MDTWRVPCQSCGVNFDVKASFEAEAIEKAKKVHEERQAEATQHRCDCGPMMNHASNLDRPKRPGDPRAW